MTTYGADLHQDQNALKTSQRYGAVGDGTNQWYGTTKILDGDDVSQGDISDAAVTDPTLSGSVIALLKGILTKAGVATTSLLKLEDAAHASGDAGVMALGVRNDARTTLAGTTGDYSPLAVGPAGGLYAAQIPNAESGWSLSSSDSTALEASRVIKSSAGKLYRLQCLNTNAAVRYLQIFNSTTLPADATVPVFTIPVGIGAFVELDFTSMGRYFSTGIVVCNSSTIGTKTIGAADSWFNALYL